MQQFLNIRNGPTIMFYGGSIYIFKIDNESPLPFFLLRNEEAMTIIAIVAWFNNVSLFKLTDHFDHCGSALGIGASRF